MLLHGLDINYRPDLPAIVARWQREVATEELQAGYQAVLDLADLVHCARWLLDLRRRNNLSDPEITAWITDVFMAQLTGRYAHPARLAFLVSPSRASELPTALSAPAFNATANYQMGIFIDEATAYDWLAEGQL